MKKDDEKCPHCGYCPHCGRSDAPVRTVPYPMPYPYPVIPAPQPVYPWQPTWGGTPKIMCGGSSATAKPTGFTVTNMSGVEVMN